MLAVKRKKLETESDMKNSVLAVKREKLDPEQDMQKNELALKREEENTISLLIGFKGKKLKPNLFIFHIFLGAA